MDSETLQGRKPAPPVPKFASFRPKTVSSVQDKSYQVVDELVSVEGRASGSNEKIFFRKKKHSSHVRHRSRSRTVVSKITERSSHISASTHPLNVNTLDLKDSSNTFFVDRVGDPQNLKYGSPNTGAFPPYFRAGAGGIIGLAQHRKIDRLASDHRAVVLSKFPHLPMTKHEKLAFDKINKKRARRLRKSINDDGTGGIDSMADYIAITSPRKRRRKYDGDGTTSDSSLSTHNGSDHYRFKERKIKSVDRPIDEDLSYCTSTPSSDFEGGPSYTFTGKVQRRREELSREIDSDPTRCDAWLALIDYQDTILGLDHTSRSSKVTKAETQSIADVKISIYEKAIEMVESLPDKERLICGMMDEGNKVWESKKFSSKWRGFVQKYSTSTNLWIKYLDFMQSDFSSFRYEEVRSVYFDCLRVLQEARMRPEISIADGVAVYTIHLYVILRMTLFMREAGFSEHAVASWQAILEYIFFKPVGFQHQRYQTGGALESHTISAFKEFWESEFPRIGEDRAQGWATYKSHNGRPSEPKEDAEDTFSDCGRVSEVWIQSERRRSLQSRMPARTIDKVEENDPYRVVLFSDLQCILVDPPSHSSQELVITAFIAFCHLPSYLSECVGSRSSTWWQDPFFRNEKLYQSHLFLSNWRLKFNAGETEMSASIDHHYNPIRRDSFTEKPFRSCTPDYQLSPCSLFAASDSWFSAFDSWEDECSEDRGPIVVQWVRQILKALVHRGAGGENLAEYYLALELRFSPSTVKKLAKSLIKNRPTSIRLYNSYALIEYHLGNAKSAENVIVTTINMSKTLDEQMQRDSIRLWSSWMWALLNAGQTASALERLLTFTNHTLNTIESKDKDSLSQSLTPPESSILLRTQNALVAARDQAISLAFPSHAAIAVECLIILIYLANKQSLPAAHSVFKLNLEIFSSRFSHLSTSQEYIHQSFARVLHYHATHTAYFGPSIIRSSLAESVTVFPQNTIFLSLYTWIEARFRIDDRVRSIMRDIVLHSDHGREGKYQESVMSHFFAVHSEINRSITLGSNAHTVRGTFERGVGSGCGAHSAGLWKLYFLFELSRKDLERAKSVFYRGMRACPWAKELYMMAFEYLRTVMGETERRSLYELMVEKELRIHLELYKTIDKRDER